MRRTVELCGGVVEIEEALAGNAYGLLAEIGIKYQTRALAVALRDGELATQCENYDWNQYDEAGITLHLNPPKTPQGRGVNSVRNL